MKNIIKAACLAAAIVTSMPLGLAGAATNLIQNGDFERNTVNGMQAYVLDGYHLNAMTDWTVESTFATFVVYYQNAEATTAVDGIDPLSPSFDNVAPAPGNTLQPGATQADPETGGHFVGVDGSVYSSGDNSISQEVSGLTVGQNHTLSFYRGAGQLAASYGPTTEAFNVTFGNQEQSTPTVHEGVSAVPEASNWAMLFMGCPVIGGCGLSRARFGQGGRGELISP